nr:cell division protein ZapB [Desulfobacterales bacterium]
MVLDNGLALQRFSELEEKIDQLLDSLLQLKQKNSALEEKVESLEQTIKIKEDMEQKYIEEKNLIRSKIDTLLNKLDHISETK